MDRRNRIIIGLLLGGGMGLAYGLVSQSINLIALQGLPLYAPPPGRFVRILVSTLAGGGVGILAGWPQEGLIGVFLASLSGALAISLLGALRAAENGILLPSLLVTIYTFLPRLFYFLPLAACVRWGVRKSEDRGEAGIAARRRRALVPIGLLLVAGLTGATSLYPSEIRQTMRSMDRMVAQAVGAPHQANLPDALKGVEGFPYRASGSYTLEWSDPSESFYGPRPVSAGSYSEALVTVRFENGFMLRCIFSSPLTGPICSSGPSQKSQYYAKESAPPTPGS
jgi:hypothetical protein